MAVTTQEFGQRLAAALDAYPDTPVQSYGRLSWLRRELKSRAGVEVSVNTIHKWVNGAARPREDKIRALAKVLSVDEVWLSLGRKPTAAPPAEKPAPAASASDAAMLVAGLIGISGGRCAFPKQLDGVGRMVVNLHGEQFELVVGTAQLDPDGTGLSVIVPEPVGDARVVAVVPERSGSLSVRLLDLTGVDRKNMGGFSVARLHPAKDGSYTPEGKRGKIEAMANVAELAT